MSTRIARVSVLAVVIGLSTLVPVVTAVSASAGPKDRVQKCQGKPVTIIGRQNRRLTGTPHRDVILTNGAGTVDARGGADLICVNRRTNHEVNAGRGDDRVVVTSRARVIELGRGEDVFRGGPARDVVYADSQEYILEPDNDVRDEQDIISTGGGSDRVHIGGLDQPVRDVVKMGSGNDVIDAANAHQRPGTPPLDGGDGSDRITLATLSDPAPGGAWIFDNRRGEASENGSVVARWEGLEEIFPEFLYGTAEFLGGSRDETFFLYGSGSANARGGDDHVVGVGIDPGEVRELQGGSGIDLLTFGTDWRQPAHEVTADLAQGVITTDVGAEQPIAGFEDLATSQDRVVVIGDEGPNSFDIEACYATVHAGGGSDEVVVQGVRPNNDFIVCSGPRYRNSEVYGEGGGDVLRGGKYTDDLLDGGAGNDRAYGRGGEDVCINVEDARDCAIGRPAD